MAQQALACAPAGASRVAKHAFVLSRGDHRVGGLGGRTEGVPAAEYIVEAEEQAADGGLARAGVPHDGRRRAGLHLHQRQNGFWIPFHSSRYTVHSLSYSVFSCSWPCAVLVLVLFTSH